MPRVKKNAVKAASSKRKYTRAASSISVKRQKSPVVGPSLLQKVQSELKLSMSYINIALGLLIVLVIGVLVFNYFKGNQQDLGPAQSTVSQEQQPQPQKDVEPGNLPGKYTVKSGDTLFNIAKAYYGDGYQFDKIAADNKLANADVLEVGQVLNIPKLEVTQTGVQTATGDIQGTGTGGADNQTIWGEKITGDKYTVVEGDWLSKIAGRAYGDIMAYDKIAKANNISNPDLIEPGTVLVIPR